MFDKNAFKESFRMWVDSHPQAEEEEALVFCQTLMPPAVMNSHFWLIEQSLQWFAWIKTQRAAHLPETDDLDDDLVDESAAEVSLAGSRAGKPYAGSDLL